MGVSWRSVSHCTYGQGLLYQSSRRLTPIRLSNVSADSKSTFVFPAHWPELFISAAASTARTRAEIRGVDPGGNAQKLGILRYPFVLCWCSHSRA